MWEMQLTWSHVDLKHKILDGKLTSYKMKLTFASYFNRVCKVTSFKTKVVDSFHKTRPYYGNQLKFSRGVDKFHTVHV